MGNSEKWQHKSDRVLPSLETQIQGIKQRWAGFVTVQGGYWYYAIWTFSNEYHMAINVWIMGAGVLHPKQQKTIYHQPCLVGGLEHFLFSHMLGMSSSQLTNSMIFQRGRSTTNQLSAVSEVEKLDAGQRSWFGNGQSSWFPLFFLARNWQNWISLIMFTMAMPKPLGKSKSTLW